MKKKLSVLTVALAVLTITTAGQRAFAEGYSLFDYDAKYLSGSINDLFLLSGTTGEFNDNNGLSGREGNLGGQFNLTNGSIFLLFADGITAININNVINSQTVRTLNPRDDQSKVFQNLLSKQQNLSGVYSLTVAHRFIVGEGFASDSEVGAERFVSFDVTDLFRDFLTQYYEDYTYSEDAFAYLVGFNGMVYDPELISYGFDDAIFLVLTDRVNLKPGPVPEPATVILWTLGGLSLAGASWRRNRNKKKLLA